MTTRFLQWSVLSAAVVLAACGDGGSDDDASAANVVPSISGVPSTAISQGASYLFAPSALDADGDALEFGIRSKPAWAEFDSKSGQLKGTPRKGDVGIYSDIAIWVSDGTTQTTLPKFDLVVREEDVARENAAPMISGTPTDVVLVGDEYEFVPKVSDADGDEVSFSISGRPTWATFDTATGALTGTPQLAHVGTSVNVSITASDGREIATLSSFSIVVAPPAINRAPVISGNPMKTVEAGKPYSFTPTASDLDSATLVFSATSLPSWAGFDSRTGRIGGTPPSSVAGATDPIVIEVSDGNSTAALAPFSITVLAPTTNSAPMISGAAPRAATEGAQYVFQPIAADADGDPLTFAIANRPTWATFNANTGRLQGTPAASNVLTYSNIVISVSDGKAATPLPAFAITVEGGNSAPVIGGKPLATASIGKAYSFAPAATDADGDTLKFTISNKPVWATFSTGTGRLEGTPTSAHVGTTANVVISVSDGKLSGTLAAFSIAVNAAANRAPTITGTPSTSVIPGASYSFQPVAVDADSDKLTFSITNKPSWAAFNTATGLLSGTPSAADVGTTSGIVITVSDTKSTAAVAAFQLAVQAFALGSARLSWTPPTLNADGTPLTNLAGYKVYWGTSKDSYQYSVTLTNPGLTSYVIENLVPGTHYFATKAVTSAGVESTFSGQGKKTIL